jgi:sulfate transport system permease protein
MPMKTEIASLLIVTKLQQFDYAGASAIALLMLVSSFLLMFLVNFGQWWCARAQRREG